MTAHSETVAVRVDPALLPRIKAYGAFDVDACFNCGNCTAVCPRTDGDSTFPRRIIRYAQVGMKEQLLASKELWTCYACGECSETCPRQAEPSEFMAASRRYATAEYDRTRLARFLFLQPLLGTIAAIAFAVFLALFMFVNRAGPAPQGEMAFFEWIPAGLVHDMGIVIMVLVVLAGLAGVLTMISRTAPASGIEWRSLANRAGLRAIGTALWSSLAVESLGQKRYREDCESEESALPWYRRTWLTHAAAMFGFLGLLLATSLDFGLEIVGLRETGEAVPLWYPVRLLGTVAGLLMMYGVTMLMIRRYRKQGRTVRRSFSSDWMFLWLLWLAGLTGFVIELALYLPQTPMWGYVLFLVHVGIAMELVLLVPFTKFAHVIYRPVSLFLSALAERGRAGGAA
jgi:quinone-modifying oxidoreductase, subunit QmoC